MVRAIYRSRQVLHAVLPRIQAADLALARETLSEQEWRLFSAMGRGDQRHALDVVKRLRLGTDEGCILEAALLHDCGKGRVPVWLRILNVVAPSVVSRLAVRQHVGWRGAAFRLYQHPELGSELAEAAGSNPATVRLIHGRVEPNEAWKYALLRAADDAS